MGNKINNTNVKVASLNFSSICVSPFQYHDNTEELQHLSNIFNVILKQYIKDPDFKWNLGKLDRKLQKERYSALYRKDVGYEQSKLFTTEEYTKKWYACYEQNKKNLIDCDVTDQQIKECLKFDLIVYQTFLNYNYNKKQALTNQQGICDINTIAIKNSPAQYQIFLKKFHSKSYFDNKTRIKKVIQFLERQYIDVLFLQEAEVKGHLNWKSLLPQEYAMIQKAGSQSMIIYRHNQFKLDKNQQRFHNKYQKILNFNKDTVFFKCKDFLFISAHLTAKSNAKQQVDQMIMILSKIRQQNNNMEILGGIDSNYFMDYKQYNKYFFAPFDKSCPTTLKKRTSIQPQTHKANKQIRDVTSQILSSKYIDIYYIGMINGKQRSTNYLPCDQHPFDHYLLMAQIKRETIHRNYSHLNVGTLNFSGICLSPFEYYDETEEKKQLSQLFLIVIQKYYPDEKKHNWKVGKIDLKMQIERYTPIYRNNAGVQDGKLTNRQQYEARWVKQFQIGIKKMKQPPTKEQIEQVKQFDWIAYETFLNFVYNPNYRTELLDLQQIKLINPEQYLRFLSQWHSKPYLNNKEKILKLSKVLQEFDVLFLQEANTAQQKMWRQIVPKEFQIVFRKDRQSLILYNTKVIMNKQVDEQFAKKYEIQLNFNKDTVYFKNKNYLLLSTHLTSNSTNFEQAKQMFNLLNCIKKDYPQLDIIVGGDFNHFVDHKFYSQFFIGPTNQSIPSNAKMRTALQLQTSKANQYVANVKDHIISNLQILNCKIMTIEGKKATADIYLPTIEHPFDHFLVITQLQKTKALRVGSLNFSGICLSPFEYHDGAHEKIQISKQFVKVMKKYYPDQNFAWNVGKIDLKLQIERYSPIYRKDVGLVSNKFISRQSFDKIWYQDFKKHQQSLKVPATPEQIKQANTFDWISYQTIINYVYNKNNEKLLQTNQILDKDPYQYIEFLKRWHSAPYLNITEKMLMIKAILKYLDVLCLQEAGKQIQSWKNILPVDFSLACRPHSQSIIIYRKNKFQLQANQSFISKYSQKLNINEDSAFVRLKDHLIMSVHMSSKKQLYFQQEKALIDLLNQIQSEQKKLKIIVGVDANHLLDRSKSGNLSIYPSNEEFPTNIKKRTMMQLQTEKAQVLVANVKDHIITNLNITKSSISTIEFQQFSDQVFLPTNEHPFDHYLVKADLSEN